MRSLILRSNKKNNKKIQAAPKRIPNPQLANSNQPQILEETQKTRKPNPETEPNKQAVLSLYEAINTRNASLVHKLLKPDIEWWFHGPPDHQHMMQLLTGSNPDDSFQFLPRRIESIGPTVLVEGTDRTGSVYWVHAWTVNSDGIISQVREYFNTTVTVTVVGEKRAASNCLPVWQSKLTDISGKSLPGLVLAI